MTGAPRIVVAGGSLAGLTAALVLRDAGCDVDVYERSRRPLTGRGVGIVAHPATIRYSLERGAGDPTSPVSYMRYLDASGEVVHQEETSFRFTSYYALYSDLLASFDRDRYHLGSEVAGFDQGGEGVTVELRDGTRVDCDLLVCADGIQSSLRDELLPDLERRYAGYVGWRGVVPEADLGVEALEAFGDACVYSVMPHSHILTYPIPSVEHSAEPGGRTINWVWYRNVEAGHELDGLMMDANGDRHEISLSPGAVPAHRVEELRGIATEALAPQLAELVHSTAKPFLQVVFDIRVPRMAVGRVCLIGDAACALRPHIAAGTAKAAEAAWMLAEAVEACERDLDRALQRWEPQVLELEHQALDRTRAAGNRVQFENAWEVGDPIPFGLRQSGDSAIDLSV